MKRIEFDWRMKRPRQKRKWRRSFISFHFISFFFPVVVVVVVVVVIFS